MLFKENFHYSLRSCKNQITLQNSLEIANIYKNERNETAAELMFFRQVRHYMEMKQKTDYTGRNEQQKTDPIGELCK